MLYGLYERLAYNIFTYGINIYRLRLATDLEIETRGRLHWITELVHLLWPCLDTCSVRNSCYPWRASLEDLCCNFQRTVKKAKGDSIQCTVYITTAYWIATLTQKREKL